MDIKIQGITEEIMEIALDQAYDARIHILGEMNKLISEPRAELNDNAPTMKAIKIDQDKIRDVIGKGGATIRGLCEETGASIDIEDDGTVRVYADDKASAELAEQKILAITAEAEVGAIYEGKVERIVDFGAFVNILPGKDGLVHISELANFRVKKTEDIVKDGDEIWVKCIGVDDKGRIKLSRKAAMEDRKAEFGDGDEDGSSSGSGDESEE